jgi:type II secretory pathway predicted ATPase ExeA
MLLCPEADIHPSMYPVSHEPPRPHDDVRGGGASSLIYEPFYGLYEKPFSLAADPRFLFKSPAHGPAFDELHSGIRRREGLIVLTGEIGTGKTTLCRAVLQHLDRRTFSAFVADPFVSREDLLKTLLLHFGVISMSDLTRGRFNGASRSDLSYPLYEFLDSLVPLQAFAVVVIDEAQNLPLPLLEEIRILSELERREKLLQVVLVGQPELREHLRRPEMRQVEQRVSVRCELTALDAHGVGGYVRHRLNVAGRGESRVEFTLSALDTIFAGSSGVPRLINRICDRSLQRAFESGALQVDAACVSTAIDDLGLSVSRDGRGQAAQPMSPISVPAPEIAAEPPATVALAEISMPSTSVSADPVPSALANFKAESGAPSARIDDSRSARKPLRRMAVAAAAVLTVLASIGAPAWYLGASEIDGRELTAMVPERPTLVLPPPVQLPPEPDPSVVLPSQPASAGPVSSAAPSAQTTAAAPLAAPPLARYAIVVASFQSPDRAARLVEELVNAGFGAHTTERRGATGRLVQVQISGYTSAIDVQRDLQRVREMPGGYADAQIVDQD